MIFYKLLKFLNNKKYQELKQKNLDEKKFKYYKKIILPEIINIHNRIEKMSKLSFLHSGHLGDLIYSLPLVKKISKTHKCNFFVKTNVKTNVQNYNHPFGDVFVNNRAANMLIPLLKNQKYLQSVSIFKNEQIDIDLNFFRKIPINFFFHSSRWYSHLTGFHFDMSEPSLEVKKHNKINNKIIIVRSKRYRNKFINYDFLKNEKNIFCIGLIDEFKDLKKNIKYLNYYDCKDFLEMAEIIKSSKFFIGNLSFAYSIAEQLKIPRLLEASPDFPVAFPIGGNGKDFYHQIHFEKFYQEMKSNN